MIGNWRGWCTITKGESLSLLLFVRSLDPIGGFIDLLIVSHSGR